MSLNSEYLRDPKTAVIEGLSSALAHIHSEREIGDLPELNLTDDEDRKIVEEITYYLLSRFNFTFNEAS